MCLAVVGKERVVGFFVDSPKKIPLSLLRSELAGVAIPASHSATGKLTTFDRATSAAAYQFYLSNEAPATIVESYRVSLEKAGWVFGGARSIGGRKEVIAKFCKGRISLTIDAMPIESSRTRYYLGAGWASATGASLYCETASQDKTGREN